MCLVETQAMAAQPPSSPRRPQNGRLVLHLHELPRPKFGEVFDAWVHLATDIWA
jgi:hypothetical protein